MQPVIDWFQDLLISHSATQTLISLFLVCAVGLLLTKIPMGKFALGVTWVFFVGILASHFGITVNSDLLIFIQNFGLVLFIYALGVQVGPSFFPSLRAGGIRLNGISLLVMIIGVLLCVLCYYLLKMSMPVLVGILSGATTNTPALAAAQSTVASILPSDSSLQSDMAICCAITYPLGVVGMIFTMILLAPLAKKMGLKRKETKKNDTIIVEFEISNPSIIGKTVGQIAQSIPQHFVVSRLWKDNKGIIPTSETTLEAGNHVLIAIKENDLAAVELIFGKKLSTDWNKKGIDWNNIDKELISKRIVITKREINGKRLDELRLRSRFGINVTRIDRSGIILFADKGLHLQLGDRMLIVGSREAVDAAEKALGNEINTLDAPNLISLFIGMLLGCMVGMIPFFVPGMSFPIRLGLAGGPIIIGILMGTYGPRLKLTTYITNSASLLIRQLGLTLYLGALGLASGSNLLATILSSQGALWLGIGFLMTMLPILIVGWICLRFWKMDYTLTCGMLCGSMANPMALDFLNGKSDDDNHNVSYATVYPFTMFCRIIAAQIMILLFI